MDERERVLEQQGGLALLRERLDNGKHRRRQLVPCPIVAHLSLFATAPRAGRQRATADSRVRSRGAPGQQGSGAGSQRYGRPIQDARRDSREEKHSSWWDVEMPTPRAAHTCS